MLFGRFASRRNEARYSTLWDGLLAAYAPVVTGPTGATLYDLSQKQPPATVGGTVSSRWAIRNGGYSLVYGGADSDVIAGSNAGPLAAIGTGDFTIVIWAASTSGTAYTGLFGNGTTFNSGIYLGRNTTRWGGYLASAAEINSNFTIPSDGSWNCYAVSRTNGTVQFWANGIVSGGTATRTGTLSATTQTRIGAIPNYGNWVGAVGEVLIYNRAILAGEHRQLALRRGVLFEARRFARLGSTFRPRRQYSQPIGVGVI